MDDYLYFRLMVWFAFVFTVAYIFLIVDMSIRICNRVDFFSLKKIKQWLKKTIRSKNNAVSTVNKSPRPSV